MILGAPSNSTVLRYPQNSLPQLYPDSQQGRTHHLSQANSQLLTQPAIHKEFVQAFCIASLLPREDGTGNGLLLHLVGSKIRICGYQEDPQLKLQASAPEGPAAPPCYLGLLLGSDSTTVFPDEIPFADRLQKSRGLRGRRGEDGHKTDTRISHRPLWSSRVPFLGEQMVLRPSHQFCTNQIWI